MDAKFYNRFCSYKKSLESLAEAKQRDMTDSFVLSGTGAKFSITFDLSWKVMKDIIIQRYAVVDFPKGSPREVLRKAYEFELISDDRWLEMLNYRNELTHDYDGTLLREICNRIIEEYIDLFLEFEQVVARYVTDKVSGSEMNKIMNAEVNEKELENVNGGANGGAAYYGRNAVAIVPSGYLSVKSTPDAGDDNQLGGLLNGQSMTLIGPFVPGGYTLVTAYCGATPWTPETGWQTGYVNSNYIRVT